MAKRKTKRKTKKRAAKKKAPAKPKPPGLGKLVNEEDDGKCKLQVFEAPTGVTVLHHYPGAKVVGEDAKALSDNEVLAQVPRPTPKTCPQCGGSKTAHLRSLPAMTSYRCFECVGTNGKPHKFFLRRVKR